MTRTQQYTSDAVKDINRSNTDNFNGLRNDWKSAMNSMKSSMDSTTKRFEILQGKRKPEKGPSIKDLMHAAEEALAAAEEALAEAQKNPGDEGAQGRAEEALKNYEDSVSKFESARDERQQQTNKILNDIKVIVTRFLDKVFTDTNQMSDYMNMSIQQTGASRVEAQGFRKDVVDKVNSLNKEVGYLYSPIESMKTMVAVSNQTDIGNRETLEELSEPLLLAQETMNVNIEGIAELGGRLYTKYGFDSQNMKDVLGYIRNTTDNMNASEDEIMRAIAFFENNTEAYLRKSGNLSESQLEQSMEGISDVISYFQHNYVDYQDYMDRTYRLQQGNMTDADLQYYALLGLDAGELQSQARSGDVSGVMLEMFEAERAESNRLMEELYKDSKEGSMRFEGRIIESMGYNTDQMNSVYNVTQEFSDFMKDAHKDDVGLEEAAADKFTSFSDKAYNWFSGLTDDLATMQETIGISFSDIFSAVTTAVGLLAAIKLNTAMNSIKKDLPGVLNKQGLSANAKSTVGALGWIGAVIAILLALTEMQAQWSAKENGKYQEYLEGLNTALEGAPEDMKNALIESAAESEADYSQYGVISGYYKDEEGNWQYGSVAKELTPSEKSEVYEEALYDTTGAWEMFTKSLEKGYVGWGEHPSNYREAMTDAGLTGFYEAMSDKENTKFKEIWDAYVKEGLVDPSNPTDERTKYMMYQLGNAYLSDTDDNASTHSMLYYPIIYYSQGQLIDLNLIQKKHEVEGETFDPDTEIYRIMDWLPDWLVPKTPDRLRESEFIPVDPEGYASGTDYIEEDQLAMVHKGEAIIPSKYNIFNPFESSRKLLEKIESQSSSSTANDEVSSLAADIAEIKMFLREWKESNDDNAMMSETKNRLYGKFYSAYTPK